MRIEAVRRRLRALGARPVHEQRVLRLWSQALPQDTGKRRPEDFLPLRLRDELPALIAELDGLTHLQSEHPAEDGSARLLVALADGQAIESVLLPRDGLCVSTQVGCAVGCVFCMTGRDGLLRQLGSAEIVAQVVLARRKRAVKKVVFMGMGEPAHNLDNVIEAIELLGTSGGIAHKNLVFSTVGDARVFERLPLGPVKPALALSLHSTDAELRARLLPRAPRMDPAELVTRGEIYARATGYPIQYQWTLLDGVNDSAAEMDGIVRLLAGKYAMLNLIPYNSVEGLPFSRPAPERAVQMARALHQRGVLTKLRQSAGQDVDAGCGQLRSRQGGAAAQVVRLRRNIGSPAAAVTLPPTPHTQHGAHMTHSKHRLAAIALLLGAGALPAMAASSTSSAASDGASASVGSLSGSVEQSSASSAGDKKVAEGDYRIIDVAAAADRPGIVRMKLQALATERGERGERSAEGEFFLYLPQTAFDGSHLAQGGVVTARSKPYGTEFADAQTRQAFFLVLADDWFKELHTTPVAL